MDKFITKRDGTKELFDLDKIINAIDNAFKSCGYNGVPDDLVKNITKFPNWFDDVEGIQDQVEGFLFDTQYGDVYKHFVTYRANHALLREIKNKTLFDSIIGVEKNDVTRENGNMNADTPAGMMMKFASETTKQFVDRYILSPEVREAQDNNLLHIHDKDYYLTRSLTCLQHPLDRILQNGFQSGHGSARPAKRIETAAFIACISMETIQNEMHGGQAIPAFDFYMAPYVRATYKEEVEKIKEMTGRRLLEWDLIKDWDIKDYIIKDVEELFGEERVVQTAINNTVRRVHQALESFVHNMNTIHSRGGWN